VIHWDNTHGTALAKSMDVPIRWIASIALIQAVASITDLMNRAYTQLSLTNMCDQRPIRFMPITKRYRVKQSRMPSGQKVFQLYQIRFA
jgi:hypothetical protein